MREAIYNLYHYMELGSKTFKELLYTHKKSLPKRRWAKPCRGNNGSEGQNAQLPYKTLNLTTRKMQTQNKPQIPSHTH